MQILFSCLILAISGIISTATSGFGAQRIKNFHGKFLLKDTVQTSSCDNVTEYYFKDAVIDNFAPIQNQQKWYGQGQRYWINKQFWGGVNYPIFVFIGGEGEERCTRLTDSLYMYQLAEQYRALLVDVEHRFYGQSIPTPDVSTKNMQYLSSSQALADLARVIDFIKSDLKTSNSKVLTIGGSYPGNLAAWFRLKYPSSTYASIASSAPLTAQTNFPEYMDVVAQSIIHFSGQACYNAFELAAEILANIALLPDNSGYAKLDTDFQTCSPMKDEKDLSILLSDLMGNVQGTVQYNNEHNGVLNITDICATMTNPNYDAYTNFITLQQAYRKANGQTCEDASWVDTVQALSVNGAGRSWTYQTCNEFGYFQTTDSKNQPFHSWKWLNLDFYYDLCTDAFDGWTAEPQVQFMNTVYGDIRIAGTNILFPSGTIDPWHALGVSNTTAKLPQATETPVYIEGTAHCHDLYKPANSDPQSLTNARQIIANQVDLWLKDL
jgi:pimeloyl-ACP methyl ester carboxylesterase